MTVHPRHVVSAQSGSSFIRKCLSTMAKLARRLRGPSLAAALIASVAILGYFLWHLRDATDQNALISQIEAGADTGKTDGHGEVRLSRLNFLLERDRFDEAQAVVDSARSSVAPDILARMLYNQANSNIRRAFAAIEQAKPDAAIPLTKLAKDNYREVLRLNPTYWDAKHNFDVASRLMRDFPGYEQDGEDQPEGDTKLWTDLPGVPRGSP